MMISNIKIKLTIKMKCHALEFKRKNPEYYNTIKTHV